MLVGLQFDEKVVAQLFDLQPDAVVWYAAVVEDGRITDFEYRYCNAAAIVLIGAQKEDILGSSVKDSPFLDEVTRQHIFEQCLTVFNGEKPLEFTYYSPVFKKYLNVQRSKALNGILSVTRDKTAEVIADLERESQRNLFRSTINACPASIALCESMDGTEKDADFRIVMVNDKILEDFGKSRKDESTLTYTWLHRQAKEDGVLTIMNAVMQNGTLFKEEVFLKSIDKWFLLTVTKVEENRVLVVYLDVNESRRDKSALQAQAEWFNNILGHSPNGIVALESIRDDNGDTIDFAITLANKAAKDIANLPEDVIGKRILALFPQIKKDGLFEAHKKVVETGIPFSTDISSDNGAATRWVRVSIVKLDNGLIVNCTDISGIKGFEDRIRDQAVELNSILDASLNGVFACEAVRNEEDRIIDFRLVKINAAFKQILKLTEEDVINKLYTEVFPASKLSDLLEIHATVVETGRPIQIEQYYKDTNIEGWFQLSISKWGTNGFVQTFYDSSKLKQLQLQLELTIQGLRRSNERLTEFSHVASHDLNEPLRKVITFSKLLNDKYGPALEAGAKDYLDRIEKTAFRMQDLLQNLLIYSRVSKQIQSFEPVDLNNVVQDVVSDLETIITQRQGVIRVDKLPSITGEKAQLRQLFQNLISNGLKFQPRESTPLVEIRNAGVGTSEAADSTDRSFYIIEVVDNGIGFDPIESEKIFQLFHRLHARHEYEGTGIGLAIVQKAMENHHGFVEASSEPGKGSKFRLYFPR